MTLVLDQAAGPAQAPQPKTGLRLASVLGILAAVAMFASLIAWAQFTLISGAVIAHGVIEVAGKPKLVQHLDGGIVEEIRTEDGRFVEKGEMLVRLDDTLLSANLLIYKTRLAEALANRDRLIAEQSDAKAILFSEGDRQIDGTDTDIIRAGQAEVFEARRQLEAGRREQLREKIRQFGNQIEGVEALIAAKERQHSFLAEELSSKSELTAKGLARASELLALQRQEADLLGQIAEHRSELARIKNSIRDTELEILQGRRQIKEQVVTELRDVTTEIEELRQQIMSTEKQLERVAIRAPVSGRVHEMQIATIGGVVPPGGTLMQIIPLDEGLSFRTRVDPAAIDQVFVGQPANIRFPAFNQRSTPELSGIVADVSATSVLDEVTGQSFFWVRLDLAPEELARLGERALVPGMPVEAFLTTEDRTVLSYLTKPFTDQLREAFREE